MRAARFEIGHASPDVLEDVEAVDDLRDARVVRKSTCSLLFWQKVNVWMIAYMCARDNLS